MSLTETLMKKLFEESLRSGWASAPNVPWMLVGSFMRRAGWKNIESRPGSGPEDKLRPVAREEAHPRSISAVVGKGRQPLHTDGAHMRRVPDVVLLHSDSLSPTDTLVRRPQGIDLDAARHGQFLVEGGGRAFLASAMSDGLRFDPNCMTPMDSRARLAFEQLTSDDELQRHQWDQPRTLLIIRNRSVLHGRDGVDDDDGDRELSRSAWWAP